MSFNDVTIGTARSFGWHLKGRCTSCGHADHRDIGTLIDKKGLSRTLVLADVESRLRCNNCGTRHSLNLTYDSSTGVTDVGPAYQAELAAEQAMRRRMTPREIVFAFFIVVSLVALGTAVQGMADTDKPVMLTAKEHRHAG